MVALSVSIKLPNVAREVEAAVEALEVVEEVEVEATLVAAAMVEVAVKAATVETPVAVEDTLEVVDMEVAVETKDIPAVVVATKEESSNKVVDVGSRCCRVQVQIFPPKKVSLGLLQRRLIVW